MQVVKNCNIDLPKLTGSSSQLTCRAVTFGSEIFEPWAVLLGMTDNDGDDMLDASLGRAAVQTAADIRKTAMWKNRAKLVKRLSLITRRPIIKLLQLVFKASSNNLA